MKTASQHQLINFCEVVDKDYEANWHHETIAAQLETALENILAGKTTRLILELPPRHGKSELATIKFPAWVLGKYPNLKFIVSSYSADLATEFGANTRDVMNSEEYQAIFNTRLKEDTKAKGNWKTDKKGGYTATGVGGSITGKGFNIGIVDDPFKNRDEADSQVIRDKVWKWWLSTFYTRQEGAGAIIIICTRWHLDDLVGRLEKQQKENEEAGKEYFDKWEKITFPALAETDEGFRKTGEPLWPEKFDMPQLLNIKNNLGPYEWSALYQQKPISAESQEFNQGWFRYRTMEEVEKLQTRKFLTIDTALLKTEEACSTGICMNWVDKENKWNLKAYRVKLNSKELIDFLFSTYLKYGWEKIGIEKTTHTLAIQPFLEDEMRKRKKFLPIEELKHGGINKNTRIRSLIPRYSSISVYHIKDACKDLEEELLTFPKGISDDVLDATAYQSQLAESGIDEEDDEFGLYNQQYT